MPITGSEHDHDPQTLSKCQERSVIRNTAASDLTCRGMPHITGFVPRLHDRCQPLSCTSEGRQGEGLMTSSVVLADTRTKIDMRSGTGDVEDLHHVL